MSHLSKEAQNEEISNHQLELSQSSESSQTTTLPSFGINNPLEKDITSDTGTDQQTAEVSSDSQVLPTHRIKPKTDELLTSSTSEEWQKFSKMEDDERQSGQFLHVSVPRKKFHEAIESSGIAVGDISNNQRYEFRNSLHRKRRSIHLLL
jgi:hypothetical protein